MNDIKMTPALHAALITLRKADAKNEVTPRLDGAAYQAYCEAVDVVVRILNPKIERR
jgi:hypothetical protein